MKRFSIRAVQLVTALAVLVFIVVAGRALLYVPGSELSVPSELAPALTAPVESQPARLLIPALRIDAKVQYAGVNAKGEMGAPNNFRDVAWYKYGTAPGQVGSAVIAGHVDNGLALPGVFSRLKELKVGDEVTVVTKGGSHLRFTVIGRGTYPYAAAPVERIFEKGGAAYLNLVTCAGSWVRGAQTYSERTVIYTELTPVTGP